MAEVAQKGASASPFPSAVPFVMISNPFAKNNLGTLIRCAAAFAVEELVVVGANKWSTHGAHGSHKHVKYRCFDDWLSAAAFLRLEKNCELCGIVRPPTAETQLNVPLSTVAPETSVAKTRPEGTSADYGAACCHDATTSVGGTPAAYGTSSGAARMSSEILSIGHGVESVGKGDRDHRSIAVRHRPFRRNTAFVVGHRNRLEDRALAVCDFLVHIEQATKTPMELGTPVTTSIVLHHFTSWARYEERPFTGEKFNVKKDLARCRPPAAGKEENALAQERVRLREERAAAEPLGDGNGSGSGDADADEAGLAWLTEFGDKHHCVDGDY